MPELQIPDVDQKTMTLLRQWAADHGRTVEDEVRVILQRTVAEVQALPSDGGATRPNRDVDELRDASGESESRGTASLRPMTLSTEDAAAMQDAWEKGLARPKISISPLPQYEG